ncbi:MAG: cystathionine gamma-synthase family protein [Thermoprotei archaeon]|nr:MAG: cystathionine gamma-synthase family protein [Thermoprotei archaeon]
MIPNLEFFKVPVYLTAMFEQPGETLKSDRGVDLKYSREENPTTRALEKILAKLEESEDSLAFNSGMAAISAVFMEFLRKDVSVVVPMEAYSTTIQLAELFSKFGVKIVKAWLSTEKIIESVRRDTRLVFIETISNPMLKVVNVAEIAKFCRDSGIALVVDNTFATPLAFKPLKIGADLSLHSATKYLAGHNDVVAGIICGNKELIVDRLWDWRRRLGGILQPLEAFLVIRGLKTFTLRFRRQCESALEIAEFLADHPKVEEVRYPGLKSDESYRVASRLFENPLYGGVVTFKVRGGKEGALRVLKKVKLIKPSPSLGGAESLLTYPVISAAKQIPPEERKLLGITENTLRLSVGLEDVEDLKEDLDKALGG